MSTPSINTTFPCPAYENGKHGIQCLAKMKLLALPHKACYLPHWENNFISDNSMQSAIYFLANDFLKIETI